MSKIKIIRAPEHSFNHQIADASCFYFPFLELRGIFQELLEGGKEIVALPGRIEVTDQYGPLHYHHGATIVFITSGFGLIRIDEKQNELVRTGDIVLVPPLCKHLSVAAKGTTMIEHIVFLGAKGDLQAVET